MELDTILNLMSSWDLTADELLFIYLVFISRDEEYNHKEFYDKWLVNGGQKRVKEIYESLKNKKIILKDNSFDKLDPNEIEFNSIFLNKWIKVSGIMGAELYDNYPKFVYIGDKKCSLRNFTKRYNDLTDLYFSYSLQIGHNYEKHKKIMELLNWAKQNNKIHYGIVEFILSHKWEELEEERKENPYGDINSTFNIYETA